MRKFTVFGCSIALPLAALLLNALLVHAHRRMAGLERKHKVPMRAPPDENVTFALALRGEKFHMLEKKMLSIIDNGEPWLTSEQLRQYTAPSAEAIQSVERALEDHGITAPDYNRMGDVATVRSTVEQAERFLNTHFKQVSDTHAKRNFVRAESPRVPDSIARHVVNVRGLHSPSMRKRRHYEGDHNNLGKRYRQNSTSVPTGLSAPGEAPPGCMDQNVSWPCIAQFYGYDRFPVKVNSESVAVINFNGWTDASIYAFEDAYFPHKPKKLPNKLTTTDQGIWKTFHNDDIEAILDVESLLGTAYELDVSVLMSQVNFAESIEYLVEMPDASRPGAVSLSYGFSEPEASHADAVDFCNKIQQLVALGTTFVTGSGDSGVSQNDGKGCPPFDSDFASSCPYTLGVGATMDFGPERASYDPDKGEENNGWSGAGFSIYFDMPEYQKSAVNKYLRNANASWAHYYNSKGRAFTDVSAFGQYINTATTAGPWYGGGTSASSPIVAGMLARLNAICKSKGKRRVGWVHPVLYSDRGAKAVKDITKGGSFNCPGPNSPLGFPCAPGWDPATGLGSLNFPGLVEAFC